MSDIEKRSHSHSHTHDHDNDVLNESGDGITAIRTPHLRVIANPSPLGLYSFASTTIILSFINCQARGVTEPNVVVAMAIGTGGLAQFAAGMWEFVVGNTFGATAFSAYGTFWMSYALIFIPGSGVLTAYSGAAADQLHNAVGFFLMAWFIFTFCMFLATLRSNLALCSLFFFLDLTFLLLMVAEFTGSLAVQKAGGVTGILVSAIGYYTASSALVTMKDSYLRLPVYDLPKRE